MWRDGRPPVRAERVVELPRLATRAPHAARLLPASSAPAHTDGDPRLPQCSLPSAEQRPPPPAPPPRRRAVRPPSPRAAAAPAPPAPGTEIWRRYGGDMAEIWRRYGGDTAEIWQAPPAPGTERSRSASASLSPPRKGVHFGSGGEAHLSGRVSRSACLAAPSPPAPSGARGRSRSTRPAGPPRHAQTSQTFDKNLNKTTLSHSRLDTGANWRVLALSRNTSMALCAGL